VDRTGVFTSRAGRVRDCLHAVGYILASAPRAHLFNELLIRDTSFDVHKMLESWQQVAVHGVRFVKKGVDVSQQRGLGKSLWRFTVIEIAQVRRHDFVGVLIRT